MFSNFTSKEWKIDVHIKSDLFFALRVLYDDDKANKRMEKLTKNTSTYF
jgi:hypothetical protein